MEVLYKDENGVLQTHNTGDKFVDLYSFRRQLRERGLDIDRVPSEEQFSNFDARRIIDNEGVGYAVAHYCNFYNFQDEKMRELWKTAGDAISELKKYADQFEGDE